MHKQHSLYVLGLHQKNNIILTMKYHTSVTGALRTIARLSKSSPYVAPILAPIPKAEAVAQRQVKRYPSIVADHRTRTALRAAGIPAVQLVILPPDAEDVPMILMSNLPANERESWQHVWDPEVPLEWRNYVLTRRKNGAITWRLSDSARQHYQNRIARLITGRGGAPAEGKQPYQLSDETAAAQVLKLAEHLSHYPGLSGIRSDVFDLAQYSTRVWRSTRPNYPFPKWPTMPYTRFQTAPMAPLWKLTEGENHAQEEDH